MLEKLKKIKDCYGHCIVKKVPILRGVTGNDSHCLLNHISWKKYDNNIIH